TDDVVREDLGQGLLVGEQGLQVSLGDLGERLVGRGEDRQCLGRVQGVDQVGLGERGDERLQQRVAGGSGADGLLGHGGGRAVAFLRQRVAGRAEGSVGGGSHGGVLARRRGRRRGAGGVVVGGG